MPVRALGSTVSGLLRVLLDIPSGGSAGSAFKKRYTDSITAFIPRAAHGVPVASLLSPSTGEASEVALMLRMVTVASWCTLLIAAARLLLGPGRVLLVDLRLLDASGSVCGQLIRRLPSTRRLDGVDLGSAAVYPLNAQDEERGPENE